jgi:hypothetical protein
MQLPALSGQKLKSYWQMPGGKFKLTLLFGLLGFLVWWKIVPILAATVWTTVNLALGVGALWIIGFVFFNKTIRLNCLLIWDILMKYTFGWIADWDPFVAAERVIKSAIRDREQIEKQTDTVGQQLQSAEDMIKQAQLDQQAHADRAKVAAQEGDSAEREVAESEIGFCQETIDTMVPIRDMLKQMYAQLGAAYKDGEIKIRKMEGRLKTDKKLYSAVMTTGKALASAIKFFKGNPEEIFAAQQAALQTKDKISAELYGIKKNLQLSNDFMRSIKLDKSVAAEKGARILEQMRQEQLHQGETIDVPLQISEKRKLLS